MELAEQIIKRKSVRKYDMTELAEAELNDISRFISGLKPLTESGGFGFKMMNRTEFFEQTGGLFRIDAPHYVLFFGDGSDDAYRNIGFIGELVALELAGRDLGTCWLGGAKSAQTLDGGAYAVSIAFGKPLEKFRESAQEFKRKDLDAIAEGYDAEQRGILEFARLAPSAVNFQPWYFVCEPEKIHLFRRAPGLVGIAKHLKIMQKIDVGIAAAHCGVKPFIFKKLDAAHKGMIYEGTFCFGSAT